MKTRDVENLVWQAKFIHLEDDELEALHNHRLDPVRDGLAKAHLRICLACEKKLAAMASVIISLADYIGQVNHWLHLSDQCEALAARTTSPEAKVFNIGRRNCRLLKERNGDWTFRFSSRESGDAGRHVKLHLGCDFKPREIVLDPIGEQVYGEVTVARREQPSDMSQLRLEIVGRKVQSGDHRV